MVERFRDREGASRRPPSTPLGQAAASARRLFPFDVVWHLPAGNGAQGTLVGPGTSERNTPIGQMEVSFPKSTPTSVKEVILRGSWMEKLSFMVLPRLG